MGTRLTLRSWLPDDAATLTRAIAESLEELKPFMAWASHEPMSLDERIDLFSEWRDRWLAGTDSFLAMIRDGEVVGATGLHGRDTTGRVMIGYWVRTGYTGQGYATEAAKLLTTAAFELTDIGVVAIHHDVANYASGRIPAKLGYRVARQVGKEITAPGEVGQEVQWEITRADQRQSHARG